MPFSCWIEVRPAPASPFGPVGPRAPAAPAGPAGPRAPAGPAGPAGPVGPLTFHEIDLSLWRHLVESETTRSWPFGRFAHALITDDAATSCRDEAVATSV